LSTLTQLIFGFFQRALGYLYYPHEKMHYLAIRDWSPDAEIHLKVPRENWSHRYIPAAAEVKGTIPDEIALWKITFAAIAPTIVFFPSTVLVTSVTAEALSLRLAPPPISYFAIVSLPVAWASPSGMDLYTAVHPTKVHEQGRFAAENSDATWVWDLYAVLISLIIAVLIFIAPIAISIIY